MDELLGILSQRDDYCIFAGFAARIQVGIEVSADIDILMLSNRKELVQALETKGWKKDVKSGKVTTLKKGKMEIDVCQTGIPALFNTRQKVKFKKWDLYVMSPEALFITKMNNQLTKQDRGEDKTTRDRETIERLRKKISPEKLRKLVEELPDEFWIETKW